MLSIAICDDEKKICDYLEKRVLDALAEADTEAAVKTFPDGAPLLSVCKDAPEQFDLIFLDIKMKSMDGVEVAKALRECGIGALIVFITSSAEYVFSGYEAKAFRYILKTELQGSFSRVFRECLTELSKDEGAVLTVKSGGTVKKIPLADILYLESNRRKLLVYTKNETVELYGKLDDMENAYRDKDFVRIHQSYLVNARRIKALSASELTLAGGTVLPVSKSRSKPVRDAYLWAQR